jgi:hypothetical protein
MVIQLQLHLGGNLKELNQGVACAFTVVIIIPAVGASPTNTGPASRRSGWVAISAASHGTAAAAQIHAVCADDRRGNVDPHPEAGTDGAVVGLPENRVRQLNIRPGRPHGTCGRPLRVNWFTPGAESSMAD